MNPFNRVMFLAVGLTITLGFPAESQPPSSENKKTPSADKPQRTDRHGDPLPPGAIARLGIVRWQPNVSSAGLAYSPDGRMLVSGGVDESSETGMVILWDGRTGKQVRKFNTGNRMAQAVSLAPDGRIIALGWHLQQRESSTRKDKQPVSLWEVTTGKEQHRFAGHVEMVTSAALAPDGKTAATGYAEIRLWDTATGKMIREIKQPGGFAMALAFSPDGKWLASGDGTLNTGKPIDVFVRLWDVTTGKMVRKFTGHKGIVVSLAFSADGKTLVSGGIGTGNGAMLFWDVASGKELQRIENEGPDAMAFSPDGRTLALVGWPRIQFRDAVTGKERPQPPSQSVATDPVVFSPDRKILASGGDGAMLLWDIRTSSLLHRLPNCSGSIAFSPDGKVVVTPNEQGQVVLWEVATGKERRRFIPPQGKKEKDQPAPPIRYVALVQNGEVVAGGAWDMVYLWDTATGKELRRFNLEERFTYVMSLASSPDGKLLAAGDSSGKAYLWEVATGKVLHVLKGEKEQARVYSVAFSADGKTLAYASDKKKVLYWEVDTGKEIRVPEWSEAKKDSNYKFFIGAPGGEVIAAAGKDENVYLLDITTGKELARLAGHRGKIQDLAFSPDGKRLASVSSDTTVLIWNVTDFLPAARP